MMIKGTAGSPPSKNGGGGEKRSEGGPEIELFLCDRLDALERALGTVRRRGMTFSVQSLERKDGELVLVFRAEPGKPLHERWLAELAALFDVRQVNVANR